MDLRGIHTKLSWTRKHRKASGFKHAKLDDITQILSEQQLGEDGPVRILVEGKSSKQNTSKKLMKEFSYTKETIHIISLEPISKKWAPKIY